MLTRIFGTVTGGRLNLRAAANSSAAIIASIPNETLLILSEHNDTWYAACYGAHTGFVKKQYIALMELASAIEMSGAVFIGNMS
jgi:SH3-like domain-containing protein